MKQIIPLVAMMIAAAGIAQAKKSSAEQNDNSLETKGTVQRYLLNPEGDVDGFLLEDGSQINFPPHMSAQLKSVIAPKDRVTVKGFRENEKVFKAESITNTGTKKTVVETEPQPPAPGKEPRGGLMPPPPPPPGDVGHHPPPPPPPAGGPGHEGLKSLSAKGKIQNQIFGRRGEVSGVILSDGSIVRFGPRLIEDSKVKTDVGASLRASGFGTKSGDTQVLEATELVNE